MNELGLVELVCVRCQLAFAVRNPNLDTIEYFVCESCRNAPVEGCDDDDMLPGLADA